MQRESGRHERFATLIKAAEAENRRLKRRLELIERRSLDDVRQLELTVSSMEDECHSLRIERDMLAEELTHLRTPIRHCMRAGITSVVCDKSSVHYCPLY